MSYPSLKVLATGVCAVGLGALLARAAAPPTPQGVITVKEFLDIGGGVTIADLTNSAKFPNNPDIVDYATYFEWPQSPERDINTPPPGNVKDSYGIQMQGYFYPPTTGDYIFKIASDDNGRLFLSTDDNPANKKLIALEPQWNPARSFDSTDRRNATNPENNSQTYTATEWPTKDPVMGGAKITLQAGRAYYIEALMKEGGGGDNLAVAVQDPGFAIDASLPIPGQYLSSFDKNSGPVSIVTQPASATVDEGTPVSFSVVADGTPPYTYQWRKNGANIDGATGRVYSIPFASFADNGAKFSVVVTGPQGSATSADATLTVNKDTTRPTLVAAYGGADFTSVRVEFSERVDPTSATTPGNYTISGGVTVSGAAMINDRTVRLTTSRQTGGQTYTLTVNNVKDMAATPNTIAPNSTIQFNSAVFKTGLVAWERYNGGGSITQFIDDLANNALPPPDVTWTTGLFESGRGLGDNYRGRGYAWFKPATTGNYVFIITADDNARLFLSTDDNPANKKAIAAEAQWSDNRQWSSATEEQRSDSYAESEWPSAPTITLQAGRSYYLEALWQEGGGGDGCEVTIIREGDATPANGTPASTAGGELGIFVDPASLPPVIKRPPAGLVTYKQGDTLTWTVEAESALPMTYQWYRNKIAIPGATSATLTIPNAGIEAMGDYSVTVSNKNGSTTANGGPADDNARAIMENGFLIEAEDWNYDGGQTVAAASTMPYTGGAYLGLTATLDVDFWNEGDESGGAAFDYNRFQPTDEGVIELKGGTDVPGDPENSGDPVANPLGRARGKYNNAAWEVTLNYAVGWTDAGDWQNYTRTIPAGKYNAVLAAAHDGLAPNEINMILYKVNNPKIPDGSSAGNPGKQQGVTELGRFLGQGTGAWSSNDFFPLKKADGSLAEIESDGKPMTLRLEFNSADGDADWIMLYPAAAAPSQPGAAKIARSGNNVVISEDPPAGATVQSAPSVNGPWTDVGPAPQTIAITGQERYFRLKR
jgi:hypothetical protein